MAEIAELMFMFLRASQRPPMKLKPKTSAHFFLFNSLNAIGVHCFWRRKFWSKIWIFSTWIDEFWFVFGGKYQSMRIWNINLRRRWNVMISSHTSELNINSTILLNKFVWKWEMFSSVQETKIAHSIRMIGSNLE